MGFGNRSSQASAGIVKRSPASVVKRLERELRRHCKMISNLHSCCHRRKKQMYQRMTRRDGVMWNVNMHSVLHYDNVGCRGMTMIRDVNARHHIPLILRATPLSEEMPNGVPSVKGNYLEAACRNRDGPRCSRALH